LIEDASFRESVAAQALVALDDGLRAADRDPPAARLLELVQSSPVATEVPDLPGNSLQRPIRSLLSLGGHRYVADDGTAPQFPAPRSVVKRKLDKLRDNPRAFLEDSKVRPLRMLKGFFR
jgi:hypothetical protein